MQCKITKDQIKQTYNSKEFEIEIEQAFPILSTTAASRLATEASSCRSGKLSDVNTEVGSETASDFLLEAINKMVAISKSCGLLELNRIIFIRGAIESRLEKNSS